VRDGKTIKQFLHQSLGIVDEFLHGQLIGLCLLDAPQ
jgi:hypothetical protein